MPDPAPLQTQDEEELRAWVTAHHEVVRVIKDCFGDRFSNNEIFDRLRISRRTGYRALGNDGRVGKLPGRKPKIGDDTIKSMIEYIEEGGCNDVGNVWKHLADKFAPDCTPKTVQDAVKKSGFKNYRDTVKLEPLLEAPAPEDGHDELPTETPREKPGVLVPEHVQKEAVVQARNESDSAIDPAFTAPNIDHLRAAIAGAPDAHVRWVLNDLCTRIPDAAQFASSVLYSYLPQNGQQLSSLTASQMSPSASLTNIRDLSRHDRPSVCIRCGKPYDLDKNSVSARECLYHKGSPQKIALEDVTIEASPESFIWSCCGGNGAVVGCSRAMHTTRRKRRNPKKRNATSAGLDGGGDAAPYLPAGEHSGTHDANIDSSLQDLPAPAILAQMAQAAAPTTFVAEPENDSAPTTSNSVDLRLPELPVQLADG